MKTKTSILAAMLFIGALGAMKPAMGADGVISKDEFTQGSYCHEKFPGIRPSTLGTDNPTLKSSDTGDVIDFYGPCDESPVGKDQVQAQRLEHQQRWEMEYSD